MYGILPFFAFNKTIIPPESRYIYVLSDHPSRASHHVYTSRLLTHSLTHLLTHSLTHSLSPRCHVILKELFEHLKKEFPRSIIAVKRGDDLFLDYSRLALANVTVCSASSFCLWPALANTKGTHSSTHLLTYSLTYSLTHSLTYLLTHSLTHSLTYLLTHSRRHGVLPFVQLGGWCGQHHHRASADSQLQLDRRTANFVRF